MILTSSFGKIILKNNKMRFNKLSTKILLKFRNTITYLEKII